MPGPTPRLSLEWESIRQIMLSVREEISNDTFALVVLAEDIDAANGNVSRMRYRRFLSQMVRFTCIDGQRIALIDRLKKKLVRKIQRINTVRLITHDESAGAPLGLAPRLTRYDADILREVISYIQQGNIVSIEFKLRAARILRTLFSAIRISHI